MLSTRVEKCDCLGECGYGPNVMRVIQNGDNDDEPIKSLINQVRGKDSMYQALGLPPPMTDSETPMSA